MNIVILNGGILWKTIGRSVGPYKIAHWIRKYTPYTVQVIDFVERFREELVRKMINKFVTEDTYILAISTTFLVNRFYDGKEDTTDLNQSNQSSSREGMRMPPNVINIIKDLKAKYPKLRVVTGGYIADRVPDYGVIDESVMSYTESSEDVFLEYVNHVIKGEEPPIGDLVSPTLARTDEKPRMFYHTARKKVYNIELDDFKWTEQDCIIPNEPLPLDVSKGCIFACAFCQYPHIGKTKFDYIRGMEYIEAEMLHNYETFGTTMYYILDDTFNDSVYKMQSFHDMVARLPFKIKFTAYIRADLIHRFPEMGYLLKDAGIRGAYHGIESLHPEASKTVGKAWCGKLGKEYIPKLYHDIWNREVAQHVNFITGLPKDTKQNLIETIDWFLDNDLHSINFNPLGVYGNTSNLQGRHTTQSLFDKDMPKYGFKVIGIKSNGLLNWENGEWTRDNVIVTNRHLLNIINPYRRSHSWRILTYEWCNFSESEVMNLYEREILNDDRVIPAIQLQMRYYYNSIMSL